MINDYNLLIFSWILYFFLHSALATKSVKNRFPVDPGYYRLIYTSISTIGLVLILLLIYYNPAHYLLNPGLIMRSFAVIIFLVGCFVGYKSFRPYSFAEFIGLKKEKVSNSLIKTGLYSYVRHPLYFSLLLVLISLVLFFPTVQVLISVVINILYLPIGIYFEERKLIQQFGETYKTYKKEVPSFIPGKSYSSSSKP